MTDEPLQPSPANVVHAISTALSGLSVQPELLTLAEVLRLTGQSKSSVYRGISAGDFPPAVSTPSGRRWRRKTLMEWIAKLRG